MKLWELFSENDEKTPSPAEKTTHGKTPPTNRSAQGVNQPVVESIVKLIGD